MLNIMAMGNVTVDKFLEFFEKNQVNFEILDYSESVFDGEYYCFHLTGVFDGKKVDGIGADSNEELAALKCCAEFTERMYFGELKNSKVYGSSFSYTLGDSKKKSKQELIERYLLRRGTSQLELVESLTEDDKIFEIYNCPIIDEKILICIYQDGLTTGVGSSYFSNHSRVDAFDKAKLEAIRRAKVGKFLKKSLDDIELLRMGSEEVEDKRMKKFKFNSNEVKEIGYVTKACFV